MCPERSRETLREVKRGAERPDGPREKTRQDVFQKSPEGQESPREAQNEKIRPRKTWRGLRELEKARVKKTSLSRA